MGTRVFSCVRVRSRAVADDARIRGMCASAARSLRQAIDGTRTRIAYVYHACMHLHLCAAGCPAERITDAGPPHVCPCAASVRARVCACAIGRARIRADTCERVPSASTACGSARRRFSRLRRSTRTSARGIPLVSPRGPMYAPPFRLRRCATAGRTRSAGRRCGAGRCARRRRRCARARARVYAPSCVSVCAPMCGHAHALVCPCVGIAARTKDGIYVRCIYTYVYARAHVLRPCARAFVRVR